VVLATTAVSPAGQCLGTGAPTEQSADAGSIVAVPHVAACCGSTGSQLYVLMMIAGVCCQLHSGWQMTAPLTSHAVAVAVAVAPRPGQGS
jgi:hypothetical protein